VVASLLLRINKLFYVQAVKLRTQLGCNNNTDGTKVAVSWCCTDMPITTPKILNTEMLET